MSVMKKDIKFHPAEFAVYGEVSYYPNCGFNSDEKYVYRLGAAINIAGARALIKNNEMAMTNTFGGLFDMTGTKGRTYSIWHCSEWTEVV